MFIMPTCSRPEFDDTDDALRSSLESARIVLPLVLDLIKAKSIVDVGCWTGAWLAVARELGVEDILGVDSEYIERTELKFPPEQFLAFDLRERLILDRRFDLAISVEVAEHLPGSSAVPFAEGLMSLAPVVLFSAAVPYQGGSGHMNPQWPSYWIDIFAPRGWEVIDCIRPMVWVDPGVAYWYAQNLLLFLSSEWLDGKPDVRSALAGHESFGALPLAHPQLVMGLGGENKRLSELPLHLVLRRKLGTAGRRALAALRNW